MKIDPTDVTQRDPATIARLLPTAQLLHDHYFRCEVDGLESIPESGSAIYFGNHCGSLYTIEGALLACNLFRRFGPEHRLYFLVHSAFFMGKKVSRALLSVGAVSGTREGARKILQSGGQFVVFPGGEYDSHKPFRERHKICFYGHTGFIRMALEERAPLVPFIHVGTHETLYVLSRGDRIAKALGLPKRFSLKVFPISLSFPFGLTMGPLFLAQPLPSKVKMKVLPAYRPWEHGFTDPEDPEHLQGALEYLETMMQGEMDVLAAARKRVFFG